MTVGVGEVLSGLGMLSIIASFMMLFFGNRKSVVDKAFEEAPAPPKELKKPYLTEYEVWELEREFGFIPADTPPPEVEKKPEPPVQVRKPNPFRGGCTCNDCAVYRERAIRGAEEHEVKAANGQVVKRFWAGDFNTSSDHRPYSGNKPEESMPVDFPLQLTKLTLTSGIDSYGFACPICDGWWTGYTPKQVFLNSCRSPRVTTNSHACGSPRRKGTP
jgi:hypothetical protein